MLSFHEWLEKNKIEENLADYTPKFIREPLQNFGLMGSTSQQQAKMAANKKLEDERAANERSTGKKTQQDRETASGKKRDDAKNKRYLQDVNDRAMKSQEEAERKRLALNQRSSGNWSVRDGGNRH